MEEEEEEELNNETSIEITEMIGKELIVTFRNIPCNVVIIISPQNKMLNFQPHKTFYVKNPVLPTDRFGIAKTDNPGYYATASHADFSSLFVAAFQE